MNTKQGKCLCAIGCVLAVCLSTASAVTCEVYRLTTSVSSTAQEVGGGVVEKMKVSHNQLVNLGLGRGTDHLVSSNEVLGIALEPGSGYINQIIVYDPTTHSNLVTIASAYDGAEIIAPNGSSQFTVLLDVQVAGSVSNSLQGGEVMLTGSQKGSKISATINGFMHIEITDDVGHKHYEALFSKGKITFGTYLGDVDLPE